MQPGFVVDGKYRLEGRLGAGGIGEVWRATHLGTGRAFAVKMMHPHVQERRGARSRFTLEARASAKINHPNVIDVLDVGEREDGVLFLVMELLDGVSLADAFRGAPPLSARDLLSLMRDSANALAAAHAANIVHRDIRPANIFLHKDRSGSAAAKVLDFGVARFEGEDVTLDEAKMGSPRYRSPEQILQPSNVDGRADLWSLGVVLFEGLTGMAPHDGGDWNELSMAIATRPPRSIDTILPQLSAELRALVRDCLRPVETRIASAAELASRCTQLLEDTNLSGWMLPKPSTRGGEAANAQRRALDLDFDEEGKPTTVYQPKTRQAPMPSNPMMQAPEGMAEASASIPRKPPSNAMTLVLRIALPILAVTLAVILGAIIVTLVTGGK